ncbi:MAG: helix-turn-helix domain-containing protein, partial [Chloroflexota bacterium]|nr:helix-turn-helix domain-containing protein [Chloroflexota bacterium]
MRQRGRTTTLEERIEIGERWEASQTDPEIAEAMGCSVRKWRRKYEREGRSGLASRMPAPDQAQVGRPPT